MDGGRRERFEDHRENSQKVFSHYQSSGSLSPVGSHPSTHESRSSALLPSSVVGGFSSGPSSATSATAAATSSSSHVYYDGGRTMSSYGDRGGKSRDDDEDADMRYDDQQGSVDVLGGIGGGGRAFPAAAMPSRYTVGLGSGSTLSRVSDRDFDDLSGSSSIPLESSASQRISSDENNNSSSGGGTLLTYRHASSSPPSGFHHRRRTSTSGLHHVQFVHHRRPSASSSSPGGTGHLHSHDEDQDMDYEMDANVATPSAESAATLSETELVEQEAKRRRYERDSARRRQEKSGNNVADPEENGCEQPSFGRQSSLRLPQQASLPVNEEDEDEDEDEEEDEEEEEEEDDDDGDDDDGDDDDDASDSNADQDEQDEVEEEKEQSYCTHDGQKHHHQPSPTETAVPTNPIGRHQPPMIFISYNTAFTPSGADPWNLRPSIESSEDSDEDDDDDIDNDEEFSDPSDPESTSDIDMEGLEGDEEDNSDSVEEGDRHSLQNGESSMRRHRKRSIGQVDADSSSSSGSGSGSGSSCRDQTRTGRHRRRRHRQHRSETSLSPSLTSKAATMGIIDLAIDHPDSLEQYAPASCSTENQYSPQQQREKRMADSDEQSESFPLSVYEPDHEEPLGPPGMQPSSISRCRSGKTQSLDSLPLRSLQSSHVASRRNDVVLTQHQVHPDLHPFQQSRPNDSDQTISYYSRRRFNALSCFPVKACQLSVSLDINDRQSLSSSSILLGTSLPNLPRSLTFYAKDTNQQHAGDMPLPVTTTVPVSECITAWNPTSTSPTLTKQALAFMPAPPSIATTTTTITATATISTKSSDPATTCSSSRSSLPTLSITSPNETTRSTFVSSCPTPSPSSPTLSPSHTHPPTPPPHTQPPQRKLSLRLMPRPIPIPTIPISHCLKRPPKHR
ncbi:hypothetical protein BGW42_002393 [Actinomortierella wolfii]|nr:hypothetical protein BGW42_002393 [Actinomortierella wolfii]